MRALTKDGDYVTFILTDQTLKIMKNRQQIHQMYASVTGFKARNFF
jgi:hypothetical protein